jgi:SWI/SNF-related matrix-associated actin-dependent regulator 1 of chromatin subfamily A
VCAIFLITVGQTRDVTVIKLVAKGTIEEQIHQCALQKLKLDHAISEETESETPDPSNEATASVLNLLKTTLLE